MRKCLHLLCFEIRSSHKILLKISTKYKTITILPLTPPISSSGKIKAKAKAKIVIPKNQNFS